MTYGDDAVHHDQKSLPAGYTEEKWDNEYIEPIEGPVLRGVYREVATKVVRTMVPKFVTWNPDARCWVFEWENGITMSVTPEYLASVKRSRLTPVREEEDKTWLASY